MKINAKNSAAIKTNVKIKARKRKNTRKREIEAGGKSLSCIFSFYDRARHKANQ